MPKYSIGWYAELSGDCVITADSEEDAWAIYDDLTLAERIARGYEAENSDTFDIEEVA